jgi:anti-anti-sigma regulatory factor
MLATALGCVLDVERGPDWLLIRVKNVRMAESDAVPLVERLWSLLEQHFTHRLVLELDGIGELGSFLVGQLLELYQRIEEHDGVMRVCGLSPDNCKVLHACHLDERLLPYTDRREAVMGHSNPGLPR